MKNAILSILFVFSTTCFGQNESSSNPHSKNVRPASGVFTHKTFHDLGTIGKINITVITITDLIAQDSLSTIRLKHEISGTYSTDPVLLSMQVQEVEDLLKAMIIIMDSVYKSTPPDYSEISYSCKGGLEVGCFWDTYRGKWKTFIKLVPASSLISLSEDNFLKLIQTLERARKMLVLKNS